ncbi:MarR family transcriptional regulator [Alicyclobacillus tolerans]|uniref:MarR family winged helix-turn-helix transcriptional regulator n=1 Tax=Alicyclobacillus tolerans TaxID=90970 RepID=UPI001F1D06D6|nr:MarR family transcriptional regulator [Alicyclobacillus tolerans]MCF8563483.1 MarR family transcriptional regulator [Alicyclobacillus tolerans]
MDPATRQQQLRQLEDLMARLQRLMHVQVQSVEQEFHLTTSQIFILRYLDKQGLAKASDIAKVAGLSPGAVTQVCDELVKENCVERKRSDDDRRVVHISVTDYGRQRLEQIRRAHIEKLYKVLTRVGNDEADAFIRILEKVVGVVETEALKGDVR